MRALQLGAALVVMASGAAAQPPGPPTEPRPIATIDFYGQRTLDAELLRKALPIHEGDKVSPNDAPRLTPQVKAALAAMPRIKDAHVELVCCAQGGGIQLFVGVQEDGSPQLRFRAAPTGAVRLPTELVVQAEAADRAVMNAVYKGRASEDDSQGHALLADDPEGRAVQEKSVAMAALNLDVLRRVLRESADGEQRAMAARFLGYAPDKQKVVADLVDAVDDPHPGVRNDAVRALLVFSLKKTDPPRIPYEPFVALLDSPGWLDLNKGSAALASLTATRDPRLIALLRQRSLPALEAMARWHDRGHSQPAYLIFGRVGGLADQEIMTLWNRGDGEALIAAESKAPTMPR